MGGCLQKSVDCIKESGIAETVQNSLFNVPEEQKKRTLIIIGSPGYDLAPIMTYMKEAFLFEELSIKDTLSSDPESGGVGTSANRFLTQKYDNVTKFFKFALKKFGQKIVINNFPKTNKQFDAFKSDCGGQAKIIGIIYAKWGTEQTWNLRLQQIDGYEQSEAQQIVDEFKNETLKILDAYKSEGKLFEINIENEFDSKCKEIIDKQMREKRWDI